MKDKNIKKYIQERSGWWIRWLGLGFGDICIHYVERIEDVYEDGSISINPDCAGKCDTDWRYQESHITLSMAKLRELTKPEIEKVLVHELMHVFLNEMREEGIDHEERVATNLQKAFLWIRDA